jgi:hypothetical protein
MKPHGPKTRDNKSEKEGATQRAIKNQTKSKRRKM